MGGPMMHQMAGPQVQPAPPAAPPPPPVTTASMELQQQQQLHAQLAQNDDLIEDEPCGGEDCCPVDPEAMQAPCNCEAVEVPNAAGTSGSERSSSYNSCTLPLKPLKGILKKSSNNSNMTLQLQPQQIQPNSMTLPRDYQVLQQNYGAVAAGPEVIPFDQVPPCDDCLQRARHRGSYGEMCQNFENGENCGFQIQNQRPMYHPSKSPTHSQIMMNEPFCCKHDRPANSRRNSLMGSNHLLVISRQNSFNEKEEVEAVESSV